MSTGIVRSRNTGYSIIYPKSGFNIIAAADFVIHMKYQAWPRRFPGREELLDTTISDDIYSLVII
jgi:hypothetical protein